MSLPIPSRLRSLLLLAVLLALLAPVAAPARSLPNADFVVKKGKHDANGEGLRVHLVKIGQRHDRRVSFKVLFTSSAAYTTPNPANQADDNKVMGISLMRIHEDSIRLGWSWDPQHKLMNLAYYGWVNGMPDRQDLTTVPLNTWVDCEIRMNDHGLSVKVNGASKERKVELGWKGTTTTAILRTAYFGGTSVAPQDIEVKVKDISAD